MPAFGPEPETNGGRRQGTVAGAFFLASLVVYSLPDATQQQVAGILRASLLRPFLATQELLVDARSRARRVEAVQAQMDSLTSILATQSAVADENRTLRGLLGLRDR